MFSCACDDLDLTSALEVACKVPNDTWYFEIAARNGWLSANTVLADFVIALAIAFLAGIGFWQFEQQRYKDGYMPERLRNPPPRPAWQTKPRPASFSI